MRHATPLQHRNPVAGPRPVTSPRRATTLERISIALNRTPASSPDLSRRPRVFRHGARRYPPRATALWGQAAAAESTSRLRHHDLPIDPYWHVDGPPPLGVSHRDRLGHIVGIVATVLARLEPQPAASP